MQFNSTLFLLFLPVVVLAYHQLPLRGRRAMLLLANYVFYWIWSIPFSLLLVASTMVDYTAARVIEASDSSTRRRLALLASLGTNLGLLGLFKYADFFSDTTLSLFGERLWPELDWVLPLGISFYTFQTMSYTIDVYRGVTRARRSMMDVALYVSFFPQLVAGPIVRADELIPQLARRIDLDWESVRRGVGLVLWGMAKKVFVADTMAQIANEAYGAPEQFSGLALLFATYAFAVQIYCDFSGYTDMAIGAALMMGIRLPQNFDSPYLSCSIREFWRRWHISLSTWLRDYLYIPLGGSKGSTARTYANLMITMLLGGLWHGAGWNWVVWGGLQGVIMSVERALGASQRAPQSLVPRLLRWFLTLHLVCLSWVFFRAQGVEPALEILTRICSFAPGSLDVPWSPVAFLALLLVVELAGLRARVADLFAARPTLTRWCTYAAVLVLVLTFAKAQNPEFIYFQF